MKRALWKTIVSGSTRATRISFEPNTTAQSGLKLRAVSDR